jgi:modulator of FtsH protease HflK
MSESHEHHEPPRPQPEPPVTPLDAGSRALEEALSSSFAIVRFVMVILVIVFIFSGVKTVGPQQKAVILRFGKPLGAGPEQLLGPGLHWAFPYPIDEVVPLQVGEIQSVTSTVGWYATTAVQEAAGTEPPPRASLNPAADGYSMTADGNILHVRATLKYRITDPLAYSFNFINAANTVQGVLNRALVYAAAYSSVDEALLNNAGFREKVLARVNEEIDALKLGITVQPSDVKVIPPRLVQSDFDAVLGAESDRSKAILAAQGYAETIVRQAEAEANSLLNAAEAQRVSFVQAVQADAKSFAVQSPQYQLNPELFRQRLLAEVWQRILARAADKFISLESLGENQRELRLLINREPPNARTADQTSP